MKRILKFICISLLIFSFTFTPFSPAIAKRKTKRKTYKVSKTISKKKSKKTKKNSKIKKTKKTTKAKQTPRKPVKKATKQKKSKQVVQKQDERKEIQITLPPKNQNKNATKGQKKVPRRCPNVRCRYIGVKPCPRHGKNYPNHWK